MVSFAAEIAPIELVGAKVETEVAVCFLTKLSSEDRRLWLWQR